MSWAAYQLIGLTALFAVWVCVHVLVVWHAFRPHQDVQMSWGVRALALVPPVAPVLAWRGRHRISPIVWGVVAIGYGVLWIVSSGG